MRILILGGSSEAAQLARAIASDPRFEATLSLAGRTEHPAESPIPVRRGGFGGIDGLARYLAEERIDILIDATHPFAATMKRHAGEAAARAHVKLLAVRRPPWMQGEHDDWIIVDDLDGAAAALGAEPKRVLLTTGRKELAPFRATPQHFYLLRSVEAPSDDDLPPRVMVLTARGPFTLEDERRLLEDERIDVLVTKNSGGRATAAKLAAARALSLPVIMVRRPELPTAPSVESVDEALAWLDRVHDSTSSAERGV